MISPLHQAQTPHPEKGVTPIKGLLLTLAPILALAQAAAIGAMPTIMWLMMTTSQADPQAQVLVLL
jgi:hypothetical protein